MSLRRSFPTIRELWCLTWRKMTTEHLAMTDYKEKFDDLQRAAKRKARELDEKLNVTGIGEDTARVAGEAARTVAEGAEQLRAEASRFADENNLRETAGKA